MPLPRALLAALLLCLVATGTTHASLIAYDQASFYSQYTSPTVSLDFTSLQDGTPYVDPVDGTCSSAYCTGLSTGGSWEVRENAFSNDVWFRECIYGASCLGSFYTAVMWDGDSISLRHPDAFLQFYFPLAYPENLGPIALQLSHDGSADGSIAAYSGFMSITPIASTEYPLGLSGRSYQGLHISSFQTGFTSAAVDVPEPSTVLLLVAGLLGLGVRSRSPLLRNMRRCHDWRQSC